MADVSKECCQRCIYVRAVKALYTNITSNIKIGSILSDEFPATNGLRKPCASSSSLFRLYLNLALKLQRFTCCKMGTAVNDDRLFTSSFMDDQVIVPKMRMISILRKLDEEYQERSLNENTNKIDILSSEIHAKICCRNGEL